ncbi:MAG TPA: phosphate acyltransferase PlsX [Acidimicrobiales bacterium]|nr:phosphate acyltransferase PlsX [Acidimicrobiales bacterium]
MPRTSPASGLPVAVDAMGGDRAPDEIVAGACQAYAEHGLPVLLIGDPDAVDTAKLPDGVSFQPASEIIEMDEDPGRAVRVKRDSSLVRCAEAVHEGRACAMVSAGNTGAAMASALLRMGRLKGVQRPAIATVIPVPGSTPTVLLDSGANVDCTPQMLVQFAQMGQALATERFGIAEPRVGLLSIGEEAAKGNALVKEAHSLLASGAGGAEVRFIGNVEGRDVMSDRVDVVVTDGFTGNVVLKTLEGAVKAVVNGVLAALTSSDEVKVAAKTVLPALSPLAGELDPDTYGGAVLLGVDGVCVISHGSSGARAIVNAIKVASHAVQDTLVERVEKAIAAGEAPPQPTSSQATSSQATSSQASRGW